MEYLSLSATAEVRANKLEAIKMYLKQDDAGFQKTLDSAMDEAVERLYTKAVPQSVRDYLAIINGEAKEKKPKTKKARPPKSASIDAEVHVDHTDI